MENASKALLISGGVLIAMLILGIGVVLFMNYSQLGETYNQQVRATEIAKFNANFTKFEGRTNITAQEILTLKNFVDDYNKKTEEEVKVNVGSTTINIDFLKNNSYNYFEFKTIIYNNNGLVKSITFEDINFTNIK
ncbi:MAG: hypothetical protein Q4G09_01165 [Clostridia bacterium]|nr:hypothetical protein [Clostridia bacterium]